MSKFALLFLAIFFGGITAAFFYSATGAFVLYELVYFFNPDNRWWSASIPGLRYSLISVMVMMMALAINYRRLGSKSPWLDQPVFKWMVAILCMYYVMYIHALDIQSHDRFTFEFTKLVIIMLIAYKLIHSERALDAVLWGYLIGATYLGYLTTVTGRNSGNRVEGIGLVDAPDSNGAAATLVPAATLLMYYFWKGNKKVKLLCCISGAFIANGLVLINSRGSFLGAVVGVVFYLCYMLFSRYQKEGQRATAIMTLVLGLAGGLYVTDDTFWDRMDTLRSVENKEQSGASRMDFWLVTFDVMKDYPMGVGIAGYQRVSANYLEESQLAKNAGVRAVHSSWFQGLAELGWPGPILFFGMMVSLYRLSSRTKNYLLQHDRTDEYFKVLAIEGALLAFMVSATFIDRFRAEILYWMILFLAAASNVYYLQHVNQRQGQTNGLIRRRTLTRESRLT
ncbi:O-antigen ligase family protein [Saccharospirillum salsuginis]|uniref:O-antigen ligase-related domain-containing protein n=1 Tax=Saccharospirillum salsuginis TaxID=418750 RepID=A0A918K510_9GAMM|nr:O-antigen ligase family protein [Saccharospirillum salsuginis]GGX49572.1 hypothetical protein GCM10007392_16130 [Saccharospirillum salsuginis]